MVRERRTGTGVKTPVVFIVYRASLPVHLLNRSYVFLSWWNVNSDREAFLFFNISREAFFPLQDERDKLFQDGSCS